MINRLSIDFTASTTAKAVATNEIIGLHLGNGFWNKTQFTALAENHGANSVTFQLQVSKDGGQSWSNSGSSVTVVAGGKAVIAVDAEGVDLLDPDKARIQLLATAAAGTTSGILSVFS